MPTYYFKHLIMALSTASVYLPRDELVAEIEQTLDYKSDVVFDSCKVQIVFPFSHTNTTSAFIISVTRSRILFIYYIHAIWSVSLSCSLMPSFSSSIFTN